MYLINNAGPVTIFSAEAAATGNWYRVHPKLSNLTFQATQTGASVGTTMSSSLVIQASDDGVNALDTALGTITWSSQATPNSDGFTINAAWNYVRAKLNSISTSTSSTNANSVAVVVGAQLRS